MTKFFLFFVIFISTNFCAFAQPVKAWIFFKDKDTTGFRIENYFDASVIERRKLQQLPAWDLYDVPVKRVYEKQIEGLSDSVIIVSRWMNGMAVWITEKKLKQVNQFLFVESVEIISDYPEGGICEVNAADQGDLLPQSRDLMYAQTTHLQGQLFKKREINGKGVRIAVIDAGFKGLSFSTVLSHLRFSGRILHTYDYVRKSKDVEHGSRHGTAVLSCMAGLFDTTSMGLAPQAEFLLYRTEKIFNEKFNEEEYWLAAAEDAEKRGAKIINTSLGYTGRRYFRNDMDGRHSLLSKAATMCARKGILVVCSAGNEGTNYWRIIATPADSDSILTVGALNPWTSIHASWSSVGPSYDKRVKPNVSAYGFVMADNANGFISEVPGTSFSSPLMAGFAACVLQMHPEYTVSKMISEIEKSAHLYPYYDYAHGYGTAQASYFTDSVEKINAPTFDIIVHDDSLTIKIKNEFFRPAYISDGNYYDFYVPTIDEQEENRPSYHISESEYHSGSSFLHTHDPGYFYYGLLNEQGYLDWYYVVNVRKPEVLTIGKYPISGLATFVFHYRGYTITWPQR